MEGSRQSLSILEWFIVGVFAHSLLFLFLIFTDFPGLFERAENPHEFEAKVFVSQYFRLLITFLAVQAAFCGAFILAWLKKRLAGPRDSSVEAGASRDLLS